MKALTCEMCGSQDMVKQDGYFICQHCGTKYSVEEAKKLMIEGTVEVQGTVKVDNSDKIDKLYKLARRAREERSYESAYKYYEEIVIDNPNDWESTFYTMFCKSMGIKINEIIETADRIERAIKNTLNNINDYVGEEEKAKVLSQVVDETIVLANSFYGGAKSFYDNMNAENLKMLAVNALIARQSARDTEKKFFDMVAMIADMDIHFGDEAIKIFGENNSELVNEIVKVWKNANEIYCAAVNVFGKGSIAISGDNANVHKAIIGAIDERIKKYDASYIHPDTSAMNGGGGCYVATAVYGSYDCPEVWTLRRFRDYTLAESVFGRLFIRLYYAVSPTLVRWFGKTEWFKNLWKPTLDKMVAKLNADGVEDTPYEDKNW